MNKSAAKDMMPPVVAAGGGLPVGRALKPHGICVYGTDIVFFLDRFSRVVERPPWGYKASLDDSFVKTLLDFASGSATRPVLLPTADHFIDFITRNFAALSKAFVIPGSCAPGISERFLAKRDFYRMCDEAGIAYPKTLFFAGEAVDPEKVARELRFPVIVKPNLIHRWKKTLRGHKVIELHSPKELEGVMRRYPGLVEDSMLQEVIPGPEDRIFIFKGCFDRSGRVLDVFTGRKLRQYPPIYGSASLAESIENKEVLELSLRFFERVPVHGLGGTEFKWDERDRQYKMIEVNMRVQTWEDLVRASGKELLWMHYCDLVGFPLPKPRPQRNGVRWVHLTRDVVSAFYFMRRGELTPWQFVRGYRLDMVDALMAISDPLTIPAALAFGAYQFVTYKLGKA